MKIKALFQFIKPLIVYLYNAFFAKIPFAVLRVPITRLYVKLGAKSNVLPNVRILTTALNREQIRIGANCIINPDCILDGRVGTIEIKDNVDIGRGTWIFTLEHDPHSDYHETKSGNVVIEENVWIASRVTILPGVTIGHGCVIACGSVVTKDIPPMSVAAGIPAKVIGTRKSNLLYKNNYFPYFVV